MEEKKIEAGAEWAPRVYEIERGMLQPFVQAIDDPNPRWQEGERDAIAPPTFAVTLGLEQMLQILAQAPAATILHGSTELECYQPVRVGDTIMVRTKVSSVRERQGKMGKMSFVTFDITCENQRQELVARCRQMIINY